MNQAENIPPAPLKESAFREANDIATGIAVTEAPASTAAISETEQQNAEAAKAVLETRLEDLPEEVRKSMIGFDDMLAEERIAQVMETGTGYSVDKIVLMLWHKFKHSEPRNKLIARLRTMAKKGLVEKDEQVRSVYRLIKP